LRAVKQSKLVPPPFHRVLDVLPEPQQPWPFLRTVQPARDYRRHNDLFIFLRNFVSIVSSVCFVALSYGSDFTPSACLPCLLASFLYSFLREFVPREFPLPRVVPLFVSIDSRAVVYPFISLFLRIFAVPFCLVCLYFLVSSTNGLAIPFFRLL